MTPVHIVEEGSHIKGEVNNNHKAVRLLHHHRLARAVGQILMFSETVPQDPPFPIIMQVEQSPRILMWRTARSWLGRVTEGSDRIEAMGMVAGALVGG